MKKNRFTDWVQMIYESQFKGINYKYIALLLLVTVSFSSTAQPAPPNGCGSGWNQPVIPDDIKIIGCTFKVACDSHDICYGDCDKLQKKSLPQCSYLRCVKGGDLYGKSQCDDVGMKSIRIEAENRRATCDAAFLVDLVKINPGNSKCNLFTGLYPFVVHLLGTEPFRGMHQSNNTPLTKEQRLQSTEAFNLMLNDWPKEKQDQFLADIKNGKIKVDFSKSIRIGANKEIVN